MRMILIRVSVVILISTLSGCVMYRNVVPKTGATMEQVYDGMQAQNSVAECLTNDCRKHSIALGLPSPVPSSLPKNAVNREFRKLPNPELKMYVYPHFAGNDEVPIPGYFTVFNAYERDHYALPNEMIRN
jgi:conjugative transfer region lipoprotein (TIGR03751 family)